MQNNIQEIGKEYVSFMQKEIEDVRPDILLHGSTVYGKISSDLDISFIVKRYNSIFENLALLKIVFKCLHTNISKPLAILM